MKILKYIINEKKIPLIFSSDITHNEVILKAHSAGFLILRFDLIHKKFSVKCYGESTSLNIKNAEDDETLIANFLNNQFYTFEKLEKENAS